MPHRAVAPNRRSAASDVHLVETIIFGDQAGFLMLMQRFNGPLYRTVRASVNDDADADDVLQNAYLLAHRKIGMFRGESRLSTCANRGVNEALA